MVERFDVERVDSQSGGLVMYVDYADLEADYARLEAALRECVEVLEKFTCPECKPKNPLCVVTGEPPCEIVSIPKKAREVLGEGGQGAC